MGPSQICGCSSVICPFEIAHWSSAALSLQKAVKFSVLTGFCQLSVFNQVLVLAFKHSSQFTVWIPFWKVKSCHAPGKSQEQERSKFWTIEPSRAKKSYGRAAGEHGSPCAWTWTIFSLALLLSCSHSNLRLGWRHWSLQLPLLLVPPKDDTVRRPAAQCKDWTLSHM